MGRAGGGERGDECYGKAMLEYGFRIEWGSRNGSLSDKGRSCMFLWLCLLYGSPKLCRTLLNYNMIFGCVSDYDGGVLIETD